MDPISLTLGLVGLGSSIFGGIMGAQNASQVSQVQQQEAQTEMSINAQKQQQMVLQGRRMQMENIRNTQRARAQGENAAVNQGAQFGSGLPGGQAQAQDQGGVNALGLSQNLAIGQNIFGLDNTLDQQKMQLSSLQSNSATYSAIGGIGSSISKSSNLFGNLFGGGKQTTSSFNNPTGAMGDATNLNSLY